MRIRHILALGLVVNAILLAGAFWQTEGPPPIIAMAAKPVPPAAVRPETNALAYAVPVPPGLTNAVVERPFLWTDVESDDYLELIENLRAAGCPDPTIRDIVVARAEDDYAAARWKLMRPVQPEFWDRLARGETIREFKVSDELERQFNALREESQATLSHLRRELPARETGEEEHRDKTLAFLPADQQAAARALSDRLQQQFRDLDEPDKRKRIAARRELTKRHQEALRALLGEAQWAEYELRRSDALRWLKGQPGLDLSEEEMRALANRWRTNGVSPGKLAPPQREAEIAEVVGSGRAAAYRDRRSPDQERFFQVARRHGLTADVARRGTAVRAAAEREAAAIRGRAYPDEEIRARAAAALLVSVNAELAGIYGEQAWLTLEKYGMEWRDKLFATESDEAR